MTRDELERLRARADETGQVRSDYKSQRRAQLKKMSDDKMKHWPNTLEANRIKKLRFVEEKARKEEEARQEIDRQEAEHRRVQRLEAIKRANNLMYEQTDKMKYLKSAKMYAETIDTRKGQIQQKALRKEEEKKREAEYHQIILQKVHDGEKAEKEKHEKEIRKIEIIKKQRKEQVEEVRAKRAAEAAEKARAIGEAMKREAEERIKEDLEEQVRKAERIAEANAKTVLANERIKVIKAELMEREAAQMATIEQEKAEIEGRKIAMKALEIRRFEKKQETRQKMIDAAVEQLRKSSSEQAIANKQAAEARAKEDALIAAKEAKRERERQITDQSLDQIRAKKERVEREWEEEDHMVKAMIEENERADKAEKEKAARNENIRRLKELQFNEAAKTQRNKIAERLEEINRAKLLMDIGSQDDNKFAEICKDQIKQYAKEGKPVYTILKALEQSEPVLIPARLDPTKRGAALLERDE